MFWVGQGNGERKENDNSYKNKGKKLFNNTVRLENKS